MPWYPEQVFVFDGTEPYVRRDGATTTLLCWRAICMDCDAGFRIKTSTALKRSYLARRCPDCRAGEKRIQHLRIFD